MKFNTSYEVIEKIEMKKRNGIALRQLKAFMQTIGNPHLQLKCIHIGGTNGKGSTSNNVATVLEEAGYKVGLFTSPYLEVHHDRIRINGEYIPDEVIVSYANKYFDMWEAYDLSMFEIDMFIAVNYFVESKVDYCVFEVGMGGDRDATNIIEPLVSAITNVGIDHSEFLGDTHLEIASKKAGIIKNNTAFITMEKNEEVRNLFKKVCEERNSTYIECENPTNISVSDCLCFDYKSYHTIKQPTLALYQSENASLAIEIIEYLRNNHYVEVSDEILYKGLAKANWKGRFEVVRKEPLVIIDGAHNKEGMQALIASAKQFDPLTIVFTALKDKPHHEMLKLLKEISNDIIVTEFDFPRADSAENIAKGSDVTIIKDYKEAIDTAINKKSITLICGSLYFISLVREYLKA